MLYQILYLTEKNRNKYSLFKTGHYVIKCFLLYLYFKILKIKIILYKYFLIILNNYFNTKKQNEILFSYRYLY